MRSPFFPAVPGGAFDRFVGGAERESRSQRTWTPDDGPLPALYVSHGAPPLFDDGPWMDELFRWAQALPKPRAILIVSAHWESAPLMLSASGAGTPLVYDFGGFHPRYYQMTYPTPDAGDLARQVRALLPSREAVHDHPSRGLDHGAWVPLKVMYPLADVPVLPLSIPTAAPARLLALAVRPPDRGPLHPAVHHARGGAAARTAGDHDDRGLHGGAVEAVVPGGLRPAPRPETWPTPWPGPWPETEIHARRGPAGLRCPTGQLLRRGTRLTYDIFNTDLTVQR